MYFLTPRLLYEAAGYDYEYDDILYHLVLLTLAVWYRSAVS
jgi:hypothetical protein